MAETCKGCYHWRGVKDCEYCHYLLDTGFPRNCPADNCLFYKKEFFKMGKGHKIPEEVRKKVMEFARDGVSPKNIARSLGIGLTSVHRILKSTEQKKSPETVSTPIEPVTEDITHSGSTAGTNIIPDVPEVVKQEESYDTTLLNPTVCGAVLDRINKTDEELAALRRDITLLEKEKKALEDYLRKYKEVQNNGTR